MSEDKSRARLGRGLASLIGAGGTAPGAPRAGAPFPSREAANAALAGERKIALSKISPNPRNPRRSFGEEELAELTASVKAHGVVQPILLRRRVDDPSAFEIVAGERRWRAARAAGLAEVPAVVREISDRQSLEIAIIENVQRADLNAIEEAKGYQTLIEEHGYTQADLGEVLGKSRSYVANTLRLLKLPQSVRDMVASGVLSPGAARTAVSSDDPEGFARRIVDGGLSVREAEEAARVELPPTAPRRGRPKRSVDISSSSSTKAGPSESTKDADTRALEDLLAGTLAMDVSIDLSGAGGRLTLGFKDLDQLDEICRLLQGGGRAQPERTRNGGNEGPRIRTL